MPRSFFRIAPPRRCPYTSSGGGTSLKPMEAQLAQLINISNSLLDCCRCLCFQVGLLCGMFFFSLVARRWL